MLNWLAIGFGAVSAVAWFGSALISPVLTSSYWGGPPAPLVRRMRLGSALNATGAFCAASAAALQVISSFSQV